MITSLSTLHYEIFFFFLLKIKTKPVARKQSCKVLTSFSKSAERFDLRGHVPLCAAYFTSCFTDKAAAADSLFLCSCQEESIDVKSLRAMFNAQASAVDTSQDNIPPRSPRPGYGRTSLPATENNVSYSKLSPTFPSPGSPLGPGRFPRTEPTAASVLPKPVFVPRPPPKADTRASVPLTEANTVKQTAEMLQSMMQRHQGPAAATSSKAPPLREQPKRRSTGDVIPLRRPLPAKGPMPLKPKRPPNVNLEPFVKFTRGAPPVPHQRRSTGE